MGEEFDPSAGLSDDDRLLMSTDAIAARRDSAAAQRLQRWRISASDVVIAAPAGQPEPQMAEVMGVMDVLILDLVLMSMPLGFKPSMADSAVMFSLPGWRKL